MQETSTMRYQALTKIYEFPTLELASQSFKIDVLNDLVRHGKIDTLTMLRLELAVQEAITNGIEHGNLGLRSEWKEEMGTDGIDRFSREKFLRLQEPAYAKKRVTVSIEVDDIQIQISVRDEGDGFTPDAYRASEALETYGRGLAMIRANVDEVTFGEEGRLIRMVKRF